MGDLTAKELDAIRAFVENGDGAFPDLSDLAAFWDGVGPDERSPLAPMYSVRETVLASYVNFSHTKRWAWDGLDRLHKVLMERGEPIPESLQEHVNLTYAGLRTAPNKPRNPRYAPQDARDFRLKRVYNILRERQRSREDAIFDIAEATGMPAGTVDSVIDKMKHFRPF